MNGILVRVSPALAVLLAALFMFSCGGGSNRVLESISVSPQAGNGQAQFAATGTFSAPPVKVTPLPVNWTLAPQPMSPQSCTPPGCAFPAITSLGLATCGSGPINGTVTAEAPADPKLSLNSTGVPVVSGTAVLVCP
jgi:hypothetical protein